MADKDKPKEKQKVVIEIQFPNFEVSKPTLTTYPPDKKE